MSCHYTRYYLVTIEDNMYYLYHRITGMFLNGLHLVPLHEAEAFSTEHEANAWINTMHNHEQFSLVQVNFI